MGEWGSYLKKITYFKFIVQFPTICVGVYISGFKVYSEKTVYVLPNKYEGEKSCYS